MKKIESNKNSNTSLINSSALQNKEEKKVALLVERNTPRDFDLNKFPRDDGEKLYLEPKLNQVVRQMLEIILPTWY